MSSFTNIPMLIQQMQEEIRDKRYLTALKTLGELEKKGINQRQVLWHKAVLESKIGHQHKALAYLKELNSEEAHVAELQEAIQNDWDTYTQVIAGYNEAVSEIQLGFSENALHIVDNTIKLAGTLPLPIELYQLKTLLMARYESDDLASHAASLPIYALDDPTIKRAIAAEPTRPDIPRPVPKPVRKRKLKKGVVTAFAALATVLLVFIIWFVANMLAQPETATEPQNNAPVEKPAITEVEPEAEPEKEPVIEEPAEEPVEEPEEETEPKLVSDEEAKVYFNNGYKQFEEENFPAAVVYLEHALRTNETNYFTDDASYFLASSYLREQKYDEVVEMAKQFQREEDVHYKESPYREGIRLQQSRALWQLGEIEKATSVLEELINKPNEDWVTYEAKATLKLMNDEQAS